MSAPLYILAAMPPVAVAAVGFWQLEIILGNAITVSVILCCYVSIRMIVAEVLKELKRNSALTATGMSHAKLNGLCTTENGHKIEAALATTVEKVEAARGAIIAATDVAATSAQAAVIEAMAGQTPAGGIPLPAELRVTIAQELKARPHPV